MQFLSGYRTYIIAALVVVLIILHYVGIDIPGLDYHALDLGLAVAVFTNRRGATNDANKAAAHLVAANDLAPATAAIADKAAQIKQAA